MERKILNQIAVGQESADGGTIVANDEGGVTIAFLGDEPKQETPAPVKPALVKPESKRTPTPEELYSPTNFNTKLSWIQATLKAPKDKHNSFGNYDYRSAEGILNALKPLLYKSKLTLTLSDDIVSVGNSVYIKATATLTDGINKVSNTAFARECFDKKGMDPSQMTGTASSYARKYALNGMFAIDDTKDADTDEYAAYAR